MVMAVAIREELQRIARANGWLEKCSDSFVFAVVANRSLVVDYDHTRSIRLVQMVGEPAGESNIHLFRRG